MTKPLRVLQVIPSLDEGGAERTVIDISDALIKAGHSAFVATSGGRMISQLQTMGATVILGPFASKNPLTIYRNISRLSDIITGNDIAIVHARSRAPAWSALLAARRTGRAFMTTHHGTFRDTGYLKSIYNSVMARGDVVIANSNFIANRIASKYPSALSKVTTIPRGVDTAAFDPASISGERIAAFRQKAGTPASAQLVTLPGRLTKWKGQEVFINAAAAITAQEAFSDVHFVLVGEAQAGSEFERNLQDQIAKLGLKERIHFTGHWDDMPAAYAASGIVVSASIEPEAFGRVAVEAQAMERPVIASALGGSLETVLDNETGWLYDGGSAEALAEKLAFALQLPREARLNMGRKGRKRVLDHFSKEMMCARTLEAYDTLNAANQSSD